MMKIRYPALHLVRHAVLVASAGAFAGYPFPAAADDTRHIVCPSKIEAAAVKLTPPASWTAAAVAPIRLHAAAPMAGPPATRACLSPHSSKEGKKIWTDRFLLDRPDTNGNWMSCKYGAENALILAKRLPDDVTECTVTYADRGAAGTSIAVACK